VFQAQRIFVTKASVCNLATNYSTFIYIFGFMPSLRYQELSYCFIHLFVLCTIVLT